MRNLVIHTVFGALLMQALACGFPRPADIEPDSSICGNAKIEPGEDCDDGNTTDDDNGCDGQCHKNAICGDAKIQSLFEICDQISGCSMNCKEPSLLLYPVSDRYGRYNATTHTWDGLFPESETTGEVSWVPQPEAGGPLEWRTGFEFETGSLHPLDLLKTARFTAFAASVSQQAPLLQLDGYLGDGHVTIQDMDAGNSLISVLAENPGPVVFDIKTFIQKATIQKYDFTGFLLRIDTIAPTDPPMGVIVALSNSSDQTIWPRLEITYCVDSNQDLECD